MRRLVARFVTGCVGSALGFVHAGAVGADDDARPDATPYRPTVTTPAALSAPHWIEAEFGGLYQHGRPGDDGSPRRSSVPYTFKYAFSEDWGVRIDGDAVVRTSGDGERTSGDGERTTGFGDTGLIVKRRLAVDGASSFGLEAGALYPTARSNLHLGSGKPDYLVTGIYSVDLAGWHSDINLFETRLSAHDEASSRWQSMAAVSVAHPLIERWQVAVEWAGTRQTGVASLSQLLGALSWSARRDIVIDFGGVRGLNHATPGWQAFVGATVVLGRID